MSTSNRFPDSNGVIDRRRGIQIFPFLALGHNAPCRAWGRYGSGSDYRQHSDSDSGGELLPQLGDCFAIGWEFPAGVREISSRLGSSEPMNLRKLHFGSYLLKGLRFPFLQYWSLAQLIQCRLSLSLGNPLFGKDCLKMGVESYCSSSVAAFPIARPRLE